MGSGAPSGAAEKPPLNGLGAVALPLTRLPGAPTAKGPAPARHPSGRPEEPPPEPGAAAHSARAAVRWPPPESPHFLALMQGTVPTKQLSSDPAKTSVGIRPRAGPIPIAANIASDSQSHGLHGKPGQKPGHSDVAKLLPAVPYDPAAHEGWTVWTCRSQSMNRLSLSGIDSAPHVDGS